MTSKPREGFVVLKNGQRIEGVLKLRKLGGELTKYEVKNSDGKNKGKFEEVAEYGYTVSKEEVEREQMLAMAGEFEPGKITLEGKEVETLIAKVMEPEHFYSGTIIVQEAGNSYRKVIASESKGYKVRRDNQWVEYIVVDEVFIPLKFDGKTFRMYRNPNPTTVNTAATNFAKGAVSMTADIAANQIVEKDMEKNDYESNMDSLLIHGTTEELVATREALVKINGYMSSEELMDKSANESLKANINALDLAIMSDEISASEGQIMNQEWYIENKTTGEKIIVYKSEFKTQMEPILMGCFDFINLDNRDQRDYEKWKNREMTLRFLDGCY